MSFRQLNLFAVKCDGCGCELFVRRRSMPVVNQALHRKGWMVSLNEGCGWSDALFGPDDYEHYCPACVAARRHEEKAE